MKQRALRAQGERILLSIGKIKSNLKIALNKWLEDRVIICYKDSF
jgi:hypothetical protein